MAFKFAYFVELGIDNQLANFQCYRHFMLLGFENIKFCETEYRLSALQVSNLLVAWIKFYGGYFKTPKTPLWCHKDLISHHWISKFGYFVEHDISYQFSKFQCSRVSGSNFMLQWDKQAHCHGGKFFQDRDIYLRV